MNDQNLHNHLSGDPAAYEKIVRQHIDMVYATARRNTSNLADAEDITQTTFLLFLEKTESLRKQGWQGGSLAGWFHHATRFCCANLRKIRKKQKQREEEYAMPSSPDTPHETQLEHADLIDTALETLSQTDRDILLMYYLQNRSFEDIAQTLHLSTAAARKRSARALEKMRTFITAQQSGQKGRQLETQLQFASDIKAPAALTGVILGFTHTPAITAAVTSLFKGTLKTMFWLKAKTIAAVAAAAIIVTGTAGVGMYQIVHHNNTQAPIVETQTDNLPPVAQTLREISIHGEVQNPGTYSFNPPQHTQVRLAEILSIAGGLSQPAENLRIEVVRKSQQPQNNALFLIEDVSSLMRQPDPALPAKDNIIINADDSINVYFKDQYAQGSLMLVQWNILLKSQEQETLRTMLEPIDTPSIGYRAYRADANLLRQMVITLSARGGVMVMGNLNADCLQTTDFTQYRNTRSSFWQVEPAGIGSDLLFDLSGNTGQAQIAENKLHLEINFQKITPANNRNFWDKNESPSIIFTGDLENNQALVMAKPYGTPDQEADCLHVIIWQAYKASREQMNYIRMVPQTRDWLFKGPAGLRYNADRAIMWSWRNTINPPVLKEPQKWRVQFEDQTALTLIAVGQYEKWPWCWWNPEGQTLQDNSFDGFTTLDTARKRQPVIKDDLVVVLQRTPEEMDASFENNTEALILPKTQNSFRAGIGAGSWQNGGVILIDKNHSIAIQEAQISLWIIGDCVNSSDQVDIHYEYKHVRDIEIGIAAILKDGTETRPLTQGIRFEPWVEQTVYAMQVLPIGKDQIDHFEVRWRKRHWVTFENFSDYPHFFPQEPTEEKRQTARTAIQKFRESR